MRALIFSAVACGLVATTASGQAISIGNIGSKQISKTLVTPYAPPGFTPAPPYTVFLWWASPSGGYDTGTRLFPGATYQVQVSVGNLVGGVFTPRAGGFAFPWTLNGAFQVNGYPVGLAVPVLLGSWSTGTDHLSYSYQTPPGKGSVAMQADLQRSMPGGGFVSVAIATAPLP